MNELEDIEVDSEFDLFIQDNEPAPPPIPNKKKRGRPRKQASLEPNYHQISDKSSKPSLSSLDKSLSLSSEFEDVEFPGFTREDFMH